MSVAYFIVAEREVEGLDTFVNGKFLAHCKCLNGLANQAGVRPLLDYYSMGPHEAESFIDLEDEGEPSEPLEPEHWSGAAEGLVTVRGLIARLEAGPVDLPDDPIPEELAGLNGPGPDLPAPRREDLIDDLREFEMVLARLATEGVRWHLAIDL